MATLATVRHLLPMTIISVYDDYVDDTDLRTSHWRSRQPSTVNRLHRCRIVKL